MYISQVTIKNFRLLKDTTVDLKKDLSLLIGKNNSGKTSFIKLFENFYTKTQSFTYDDFSLSIRDDILNIDEETNKHDISIQLILEITYEEGDNLEHISDFIMDLDDEKNTVNILFECSIQQERLLRDLSDVSPIENQKRFIRKMLPKYLQTEIFIFEKKIDVSNRSKLGKKELADIRKIINFQVIHAKRDVASSEGTQNSKKILSELTTQYYNDQILEDDTEDGTEDYFAKINEKLIEMDIQLEESYKYIFEDFLKGASNFLGGSESLKVISNLESEALLYHSSQVIYGHEENTLPENLNGLGYMNILYLLLQLEIHKKSFEKEKRNINLLFIEEPEAHTHPQLQYVFARKIKKFLEQDVSIQTIITTHSPHVVSEWEFEDIRYFKVIFEGDYKKTNVKNFVKELKHYYKDNEAQFKFLKQYLTLNASELFFAEKIIFIEGTTERMLLPYFVKRVDSSCIDDKVVPLSSQNVTVLEVGANAKIFEPFINFFDIKTLIITDLDTIDTGNKRSAVSASCGNSTSNETLKHFYCFDESDHEWIGKLKNHELHSAECGKLSPNLKIAYQKREDGQEINYQGRSFEDAFININFSEIKDKVEVGKIQGLQYKKDFKKECEDVYTFTNKVLKGKSDFASSLLFLVLSEEQVEWNIPSYIKEGLEWLKS